MDVRLSPEQEALRDSVAQVVARHGPRAVGALVDEQRRAALDGAVAASGWRALRGADDAGGPLASAVEVALVAEQLGRGLADASFLGPTLAAELRRLTGAPGSSVPETVVLGPDLSAPAAIGGDLAGGGVAIDAAGAEAGPGAGPVARRRPARAGGPRPGPRRGRPHPARRRRRAAPVEPLDGRPQPLRHEDRTRWTALGLAVTSADLVGVMAGAVRLAADYATERRQYGAPIGSFQAVQHLLADAHVATEGSRSAALHAAWAVDALAPDEALAAASVAKAYCTRAARSVCETAIQVHGGIGNTWECLAHVFLRRALVSSDVLGGVGPNLARVLAHQGVSAPSEPVGGQRGLR
ncbi:MAG: acyl-CoA dehydrogenase family protein [Acidimicrobiales bacterium]